MCLVLSGGCCFLADVLTCLLYHVPYTPWAQVHVLPNGDLGLPSMRMCTPFIAAVATAGTTRGTMTTLHAATLLPAMVVGSAAPLVAQAPLATRALPVQPAMLGLRLQGAAINQHAMRPLRPPVVALPADVTRLLTLTRVRA